ncbi:MAG: type II toxin-antitoxin system RelE/ParE family toxin [Dehalococcoidia bacterium]
MPFARLSPTARAEFDALIERLQAGPVAEALALIRAIDAGLERIEAYPELGRPLPGGFRQFTLARTSYSIVYRDLGSSVEIVAFAHASRRPGYWRSRLS